MKNKQAQFKLVFFFLIFLLGCDIKKDKNNVVTHTPITEEKSIEYHVDSGLIKMNTLIDFFNEGYTILDSAAGDLNKDQKDDVVAVLELKHKTGLKRIAVIFLFDTLQHSLYKSALSESLILLPVTEVELERFDQVKIKNGTIIVSQSLIKGWFQSTFRLQNRRWELIKCNASIPGEEYISELDFNLNTGAFILEKQIVGEDSIFRKINGNKIISPLPSFNTFEPFTIEITIDGSTIWI